MQVAGYEEGATEGKPGTFPNGGRYVRYPLLGAMPSVAYSPATAASGPQFHLARQLPNTIADVHYHVVPQWQVVVEGAGSIGKHDADAYALHYVDAYTGYGPIKAGEGGLSYFVLRSRTDIGAQYVSESAAKAALVPMRGVKRRSIYVSAQEVLQRIEALHRAHAQSEVLVPRYEDGLAAWIVHLPSNTAHEVGDGSGAGGQAMLLLEGDLAHEQSIFGKHCCAFNAQDNGPISLRAGPRGLVAMVLQFPRDGADPHLRKPVV